MTTDQFRTRNEIILGLLRDAADLWKLDEAAQKVGIEIKVDPFEYALDLLGVPSDNTVETHACEIANATGEWPEGTYCRDSFVDEWCELGFSPERFVEYVEQSCPERRPPQ